MGITAKSHQVVRLLVVPIVPRFSTKARSMWGPQLYAPSGRICGCAEPVPVDGCLCDLPHYFAVLGSIILPRSSRHHAQLLVLSQRTYLESAAPGRPALCRSSAAAWFQRGALFLH